MDWAYQGIWWGDPNYGHYPKARGGSNLALMFWSIFANDLTLRPTHFISCNVRVCVCGYVAVSVCPLPLQFVVPGPPAGDDSGNFKFISAAAS